MTLNFNLWSYPKDGEAEQPAACREVTLHANPADLRVLAQFILDAAARMEAMPDYDGAHFHLRDVRPDLWRGNNPDLIVFGKK